MPSSSLSRFAFLRCGRTRKDGQTPVERDRLMILVIVRIRTEAHFFKRDVGIGSRQGIMTGHRQHKADTSASGDSGQ